jgi:glycine hydroxymethyltransferase
VCPDTGLVNYEQMEERARAFIPKCLVGGGSAYSRPWDFARMRQIADINGSFFFFDMAHISGLVATGTHASPFEYADVVTTTTHKTLRGPRSGVIFYRKKGFKTGAPTGFGAAIDEAVFPGLQGGPHNVAIGGLAVALKHAMAPEFKLYQEQVIRNSKMLAACLMEGGFSIATGGTDNHIFVMDMRQGDKATDLSGGKMQTVCDRAHITLNKNTCPGDLDAMNPSGVRIGTPAMTTRGLVESDFKEVARMLLACADLAKRVQAKSGKKLVDFIKLLDSKEFAAEIATKRKESEDFATKFVMPGF